METFTVYSIDGRHKLVIKEINHYESEISLSDTTTETLLYRFDGQTNDLKLMAIAMVNNLK